LKPPDISSLADAALEVLDDQPRFRNAARSRAEDAFDVEPMVDAYLKVLL
jgi:glycosyltransferase involved in cell wall biosynthesis